MNFKYIFSVFLMFLSLFVWAQKDSVLLARPLKQYPEDMLRVDDFGNKYYYDVQQKAKIYEINGETVVVMDEIVLLNKPKFNNQLDQNYYYFLNKKLSRVYPLFLKALYQYRDIQHQIETLEGSEKRKLIKQKQNELANQYETQLRDLTTTEGRVFAKLMNRATGKTVYDIIRELRGGWSAFWWNVKGSVADIDIKEAYNPHADRSDAFIESLLRSNWALGYLRPYPGAQNFKISK
jgi:hypothetical protein